MKAAAWMLASLLVGGAARADEPPDRPSDEDIFGGSAAPEGTAAPTEPASATAPGSSSSSSTITAPSTSSMPASSGDANAATAPNAGDARDSLNLGDPSAAIPFSTDIAPEDPLKMGGQFYWRAIGTGRQGQYPQDWNLSTPALLDVYMDARPNDRVRAFALARMSYDPTLPPSGTAPSSSGGVSGGAPQASDSVRGGYGQGTRGPDVALDQLWLRFDVLRRVFVTAGKQHVRWGTGRLWAPTDYMHMEARNPLLPFDPRTGTTMLKLHVPWEEKGWNFYAYALPESGTSATSRPVDVAGALRAEIVLGSMEIGAGVFGRRRSKARFAADVSFGLWDLDFYGEAAVRNAGEVDFVSFQRAQIEAIPGTDPVQYEDAATGQMIDPGDTSALVDAFFPVRRGSGWKPQVTGGVSYTRLYADRDTFTVGVEYFYNGLGYSDPRAYPGVLFLPHSTPLANPATSFYLGRHYLGVFANVPAPYSWDLVTFTLSSLANLSDQSGITRLDFALTVLTHIRFEAYGAVHWGQRNGEFRFGIDGSSFGESVPAVKSMAERLSAPPALFDLGVGLRVAL